MTADTVSSWANGLLVASLILGVVATYAIVASGNIKEKTLKRDLAQANADAAKANEKAAQLEVTAENIRKHNLELSHQLEEEKIKRLNLEKSLEPRSISQESAIAIISSLAPFKGQKVQLVWFISSPETINFANQIHRILLAAGWMVFPAPIQRNTDIPTGVCFSTLELHSRRPAVIALEKAFKQAIPNLARCQNFGGLLPFAEYRDADGNAIKASETSPSEIIELWVGVKEAPSSK